VACIILPLTRKAAYMTNLNQVSWTIAVLLIACRNELARAVEPPSDLCSMLPPAVVNKTLGDTYGAPAKTVAPRPFPNTNEGTDCTYKSGQGGF
jgi:hypothetical protein